MPSIRDTVLTVIQAIARRNESHTGVPSLDASLRDILGFDSLDLAHMAADLEIKLGLDPFASLERTQTIRTVEDVCQLYEQAGVKDGWAGD